MHRRRLWTILKRPINYRQTNTKYIIAMKRKLFIMIVVMLLAPAVLLAQTVKFISVKGKDIIGPDGKPFIMRGTNLGNWLMPEGYMFKFNKTNSPKLINEAITELLGSAEAGKFWDSYLHTYILEGDIHYLKSIGVNSIRI